MANSRVADMSDDELLAVIRPRPWEKRLERIFLSGWSAAVIFIAAAALVGIACAAMYDPSGMHVIAIIACVGLAIFAWVLVAFLMMIIVLGIASAVAGWRSRLARRELRRRYGGASPAHYLDDACGEATRPEGPHWVAIFSGNVQPHGGDVLLRLRVAGPDEATLEVRGKRDAYLLHAKSQPDLPELHSARVALDDAEVAEAIELLRAQRPGETEFDSRVIDGFPCHLVIAGRELAKPSTLSCNLAGLPREAEDHPAVRLAMWMLSFRDRVASSRVLMGSCDSYTGQIRITSV